MLFFKFYFSKILIYKKIIKKDIAFKLDIILKFVTKDSAVSIKAKIYLIIKNFFKHYLPLRQLFKNPSEGN